jgi:hypothetical protein
VSTEGESDDEFEGEDEAGPDPMNPEAWYGQPGICGSCIAWRPEEPREGERVAAGACRLRPELRRVPATLTQCSMYKPRGAFTYRAGAAPSAGEGKRKRRGGAVTVLRRNEEGTLVRERAAPVERPRMRVVQDEDGDEGSRFEPRAEGERLSFPRPEGWFPPRRIDVGTESPAFVQSALVELVREELGRSRRELAPKFKQGGKVEAVALDGTRTSMSATRFFAMLDRLRSALDRLEAELKRAPGIAEEREELVTLVRRMHGSFTTFNVLLADREDHFSGKE